MARTAPKSALVSATVGLGEFTVFCLCTLFVTGPGLLALRWLIGASGSTTTYVLSRRWAFGKRDQQKRRQASKFATTTLLAVTLGTVVWGILHGLGIDPRLAHVLSMAGVWVLFTYPMMRGWVFRTRRRA